MTDQPRALGHRRPHRKTRSGCIQCKERRIKCDEGKPRCGRCIRYDTECIYVQATKPKSRSTEKVGMSPPVFTPSLSHSASPITIPASPSPMIQTIFAQDCNVQDLELIHFYTTTTCFSFTALPERQRIWQTVIPRLAFQHEFLLHGLLATSALHLSRMQPTREKELLAHATMHHETALKLFKPVMSDINSTNCDASFCFSSLLVPYSSASSSSTTNLFFSDISDPTANDAIEWCRLLRGVHTMLKLNYDETSEGPLKPLFSLGIDEGKPVTGMPPENKARLLQMQQLWDPALTNYTASDKEVLDETLHALIKLLDVTSHPEEGICIAAVALCWPINVPEAYLTMVYNRQKEALILLAHFCLLLTLVDHYWWMNGVSRNLLQAIHKTIGSEWESWIMWPLQDLVLSEFRNTPVLL